MTEERYNSLSNDEPCPGLLAEEFAAGWHFCGSWDGLLIGPGWTELAYCSCFEQTDPRHKLCVDMRAVEDKRLEDYEASMFDDELVRDPADQKYLDIPPNP